MIRQSVLITGASRGIGRSCALTFAKEGYYVFINCSKSIGELSDVYREIIEFGGSAEIVVGDVGNPEHVRKIFMTIARYVPGIDILINNAGSSHIGLMSEMSNEEWDAIIRTNLSSVFYCSRAVIPFMVSQQRGKIINISSMWGRVGASCESAYSAAKAGVNGLTMALAKELAPSNIQVNAIACGVIDTLMNESLGSEEKEALKQDIPACRFGTPEEVAHLVYDLATNHAYLTGQIIGFDGGYL